MTEFISQDNRAAAREEFREIVQNKWPWADGFLVAGGLGPGWHPIIYRLLEQCERYLPADAIDHIVVSDIKEKYGSLRIYAQMDVDDKVVDNIFDILVGEAEELSEHTCDICGRIGRMMGRAWLVTRCDIHAPKGKI